MALMNRELAPEVETIFIVTDAQYSYLSSSAVKEVFQFGDRCRAWSLRGYTGDFGKGFHRRTSYGDGLLDDIFSPLRSVA